VEEVQEGELLPAIFAGAAALVRIIRWHGCIAPIVIKAGAIDGEAPVRDLSLTEQHAIAIGGCLIAAGNLINGSTIVRGPRQEAEFFNIRLAGHDVIYAQGGGCETLYCESDEEPCLPRYRYRSRRHETTGYLRSALSPVVDLRNRADLIRDRLDLAA